MPTNITQIEDEKRGVTVLRVAGSMYLEDALLLEKIALGISEQTAGRIMIDLADIHFLDSDSAPVIKRMEREHRFQIEGLMIFLQKTVEETESRNED